MPPSPAYPGTVRATITYTLPNTDVAENVLHFAIGDTATIDNTWAGHLEDTLYNLWTTNLQSRMHTGVKYAQTLVQDLRTTPYPTFLKNLDTGNGSNAGDPMPYQMAGVISVHTTHPGRSGRGRIYVPGFTEGDNTSTAAMSSTLIAALLAYGNGLHGISTVGGQDCLFGVLSRKNSLIYDSTFVTVDSRWDVQRRRANRRLS